MNTDDQRKRVIYLTIGIVTLLILVVGVAYAYFQVQSDDGKSANLNATTGTTDVLSFLMTDIDTTTDHIEDTHNRNSGNENTEIVINASQDNFGEKDKSLGDGVSAKAILKANNTTNTAEQTYNVFFVMEEPEDNLIYTIDENHPELIMTVIDPEENELKEITGLKYHNADPENANDVSGFDITGRSGAFAIKTEQKITVEKTNEKHETEQEWKIKVTLINFPNNNQNENTRKEINGEVVITQEDKDTYKLVHVNKVNETNKTAHSITTSLDYDKGTNEIKEYYFGIEEIGPVSTASLEEVKFNKSEENEYTFTDLKDNTDYKLYGYVVDSEGFKSNTYEGETNIATEKAPVVDKVSVTSKSYNEINISVEATPGTNEIVGYEYSISGAKLPETKVTEETSPTYKFDNLSESQEYQISVRAKDNKENYSLPYKLTKSTAQIYRYEYTENRQETGESYAFIVPSDGTYKIELWGASGGTASAFTPGMGAYVKGNIVLTKDESIYIYVGEGGVSSENVKSINGSFNGGAGVGLGHTNSWGGSGGGATDIRIEKGNWKDFNSLKSRIMVAAGGGAAASRGDQFILGVNGGSGGTLNGIDGSYAITSETYSIGYGGTQVFGGKSILYESPTFAPTHTRIVSGFGYSDVIRSDDCVDCPEKNNEDWIMWSTQVGGGGGYYGGGSSIHGSAGGGSSFISGYKGCVAIKPESTESNIQPKDNCTDGTEDVICSYHYSGKVFTESNMIAGNAEMPNHEGTGVMIGNTGNGYAKITPISIADE